MTAFEILLNKLYETIENNEPKNNHFQYETKSSELFKIISNYIETAFSYGELLSYKHILADLIEKSADILQNTTHEEWAKVKYVFIENDLHIIRRDRDKSDIQNLKMRLDQIF
jgi:GTPase SAR1 family protein